MGKQFDHEYAFLLRPFGQDSLPSASPDDDTANKNYESKQMPTDAKPLIFLQRCF